MYRNPITYKKHRSWEICHREIGKHVIGINTGRYDEIIQLTTPPDKRDSPSVIGSGMIMTLFRPALEEEYINLDSKGRGSCLNHDLYAYDPTQGVAIIQARQYYKQAARHFGATRKTYFLCGKNEITGNFFRHPVGSHAVRAACKKSTDKSRADVILAIQRWLWQVTDKQLSKSTRQGDILLVPEPEPKNAKPQSGTVIVGGSHKILADEIRENGKLYAKNPTIIHTKEQHNPVEKIDGWYSIRVSREAHAWNFADRIGD